MSLITFRRRLQESAYGENDKTWFPRWLARYSDGKTPDNGFLPVTEPLVVEFSKSLLKSGTPAWQRLQGVRAVEAYRVLVLGTSEPCLNHMKTILGRLADGERNSGSPSLKDEQQIAGIIDPSEPSLVQQMRRELRLRHKALETERAYIGWIMRFIRHCGSENLQAFGEAEIKTFLTELAVEGTWRHRRRTRQSQLCCFCISRCSIGNWRFSMFPEPTSQSACRLC